MAKLFGINVSELRVIANNSEEALPLLQEVLRSYPVTERMFCAGTVHEDGQVRNCDLPLDGYFVVDRESYGGSGDPLRVHFAVPVGTRVGLCRSLRHKDQNETGASWWNEFGRVPPEERSQWIIWGPCIPWLHLEGWQPLTVLQPPQLVHKPAPRYGNPNAPVDWGRRLT